MNVNKVLANVSIFIGGMLIVGQLFIFSSYAHFHLDWVCEAVEIIEVNTDDSISLESLKSKCGFLATKVDEITSAVLFNFMLVVISAVYLILLGTWLRRKASPNS